MLERFSITSPAEVLEKRFEREMPKAYKPLYNIAPTELAPVVTNDSPKGFSFFYWGERPETGRNRRLTPKLYLAGHDTLQTKATNRNALKSRRCLVPADGFFEWKVIGKKTRIPYRIHMQDKLSFAMAGLWDEYLDEDSGEMIHTFRLITTPANKPVGMVTETMPAILTREMEDQWLKDGQEPEQYLEMLQPYPKESEMDYYTCTAMFSKKGVNGPEVLRPAPSADQHGNLTLFS
ncbi:SOS response-associated peptidase [Roseivirga sp. BDSF3-8]|uniref:SOS response-associated peptidase n=1 Tax=Roseivirga sp. BDSF3-8 TaxID=3241598 RepID=UPI0035319737